MHVKICGITTIEDALMAVDAGADAIGLVFYHASPRYVDFRAATRIVERLPCNAAAVGVFVNPSIEELRKAAAEIGIDAVQLHGDESPEFVSQIEFSAQRRPRPAGFLPGIPGTGPSRVATIKAFRVRDSKSLEVLPRYETDLWLLDSYVPGEPGGTGERFNWR
ncbi:MAG: phosphoribosylanthranilate isomerase, partial [Verrucomicrobiia bacterium]